MPDLNPYAPPKAPFPEHGSASADGKLTKAQRTNLINRRTVALLLDGVPYHLLIGVPATSLLTLSGHRFPWGWLIYAPLYLFRDAFGGASLGKRLVGLGLARAGSDAPPTLFARMLRGVPLMIPFVSLIEYFSAYYGNEAMQRIGDAMAGTRVVDLAPERFGKTSWSWQLLVVCVVGLILVEGSVLVEAPVILSLFRAQG